ncbi:MAG: xylulokinase [Anaerolineales bacterium]|nr:xylulokinase [Anaerolineales bacterium]
MSLFLGLDIGTTGAKALLADDHGRILATATAEYPLSAPQPLWSEQDPADWWHGAQTALRAVVAQAGADVTAIAGLGLTGQMHGSVFLDAAGQVIRPALLWNDQRTAAECAEITARVGAARLIEIAGNPALTGFQAPKIVWLRNHEPENYARVAQVLLPKDYIRWRLTGAAGADAADAAGTLLLDLRARDYSAEILDKLDIPRAWLPRVYEGPEVTGHVLPEVAAALGLPAGLPVIAGGGDNAAAAVGTGIVRAGVISSSLGTSGVIFAHADEIALDPRGRLHTFCHSVPGRYHLMAVTLSAGGAFRWLRDVLGRAASYAEMTAAAVGVPAGAEGLLFLPYLTGERTPHLDPLARGAFVGLTARHTQAHLIRAVMEGVVFSLRDGVEIMRALGVPITQVRATGGGGRSPLWRQMQADIYGAEVVSLAAEEGPAYGAALLAGVGTGAFKTVEDAVERCVTIAGRTVPDAAAQAKYEAVYQIYTGVYDQVRELSHVLAQV